RAVLSRVLLVDCPRCSTRSVVISFSLPPPPTTEIYPLSLHDALPICKDVLKPLLDEAGTLESPAHLRVLEERPELVDYEARNWRSEEHTSDSSHGSISYAVFCLKKKKDTTSKPSNT